MLRIDTRELIKGLKEVGPSKPEYLEMLRFFFLMENNELDLSNFKAKTLENILEKYYDREGRVFERSLYHFSRIQQVLVKTKGRTANGFI